MNLKIICISVLIVFILTISGFVVIQMHNSSGKGITAMEGRELADNYASEINSTAELFSVRAIGEITGNGKSTQWRYIYGNFTQDMEYITGFEIVVDSDFNMTMNEIAVPITNNHISNWSIDSPRILELAKDNSAINQWLHEYSGADLETIVLTAGNETSIWYLLWSDSGFIDDPHSALIKLDATTGEVLYVEVDD